MAYPPAASWRCAVCVDHLRRRGWWIWFREKSRVENSRVDPTWLSILLESIFFFLKRGDGGAARVHLAAQRTHGQHMDPFRSDVLLAISIDPLLSAPPDLSFAFRIKPLLSGSGLHIKAPEILSDQAQEKKKKETARVWEPSQVFRSLVGNPAPRWVSTRSSTLLLLSSARHQHLRHARPDMVSTDEESVLKAHIAPLLW